MAKPTFSIKVSDSQLDNLKSKGFSSDSGTLPETSGVILSYIVSGNTITFTVEKKSFYVPVSMIQSRVQSMLSDI